MYHSILNIYWDVYAGAEASLMDPQQRMLLECMAEAVAASHGTRSASTCGVFVGISSMDYNKVVLKYNNSVTPYTSTGASLSVAAGRAAYTFNFRGPAVTIDTACSSSLVSMHAAINALTLGQCSTAINAGVNLTLSPDTPAAFQTAGMLAQDGRWVNALRCQRLYHYFIGLYIGDPRSRWCF